MAGLQNPPLQDKAFRDTCLTSLPSPLWRFSEMCHSRAVDEVCASTPLFPAHLQQGFSPRDANPRLQRRPPVCHRCAHGVFPARGHLRVRCSRCPSALSLLLSRSLSSLLSLGDLFFPGRPSLLLHFSAGGYHSFGMPGPLAPPTFTLRMQTDPQIYGLLCLLAWVSRGY